MNGHQHEHENESDELQDDLVSSNEVEEAIEEALELDTQSQIFLEMRRQNLDLLRIAAEVAGCTGQRPMLKPQDVRGTLKTIWDIYSEFYAWIDPEEDDEDEEEEDDDQ